MGGVGGFAPPSALRSAHSQRRASVPIPHKKILTFDIEGVSKKGCWETSLRRIPIGASPPLLSSKSFFSSKPAQSANSITTEGGVV